MDKEGTTPLHPAPHGTEVCGLEMGYRRSDFIISGEVYADKSWCVWDAELEAQLLASGRGRARFALLGFKLRHLNCCRDSRQALNTSQWGFSDYYQLDIWEVVECSADVAHLM